MVKDILTLFPADFHSVSTSLLRIPQMTWYAEPLPYDSIERQRCLVPPRFLPGEVVRTIVGTVGDSVVQTEIVATVAWYSYHWERQTWTYRLALPGQRKNRRYLECELESVQR